MDTLPFDARDVHMSSQQDSPGRLRVSLLSRRSVLTALNLRARLQPETPNPSEESHRMSSRRTFSRRSFIGASAAAAASLGVPTLLRAQAKPIRIGLVNPMTGFLAYSGAQCRLGAMPAIDEINAAGGI